MKFDENQRSATASIKIVEDDVVENIESFLVRLILPSKEVREKRLKLGDYRYAVVYIRDSELLEYPSVDNSCSYTLSLCWSKILL